MSYLLYNTVIMYVSTRLTCYFVILMITNTSGSGMFLNSYYPQKYSGIFSTWQQICNKLKSCLSQSSFTVWDVRFWQLCCSKFKSYRMLGYVDRQLVIDVFKNGSDLTALSAASRRVRSVWSWKWNHYNTSERHDIINNRQFVELKESSFFIALRQVTECSNKKTG
jgi:hypothetical protein